METTTMAINTTQPTLDQIEAGDKISVHIKNEAPIGGDTQFASFTAEDIQDDRIVGVDKTWGDEAVLSDLSSETPHYEDGGKSGEVTQWSVVK